MLYSGAAGFIRAIDASMVVEAEAVGATRDAGCAVEDMGGLPSCT